MTNRTTTYSIKKNGAHGAAVLELAIVLPLVFAVVLSGFEFSRYLEQWQIATSLSREIANLAFRECAADRDEVGSDVPDRLSQCIALEHQKLREQARGVAPELKMITTVYRMEPGNSVQRTALFGATNAFPTRFQISDFQDFTTTFGQTIQLNRVLVIGEVYIPYRPFGIRIPGLFSNTGDAVYGSTIM